MLYTPPVTPWESVIPEGGSLTCLQEGANEGRTSDGSEVVTRYPYRKVGMDHLLSMEKDLIIYITYLNLRIDKIFCLVLRDCSLRNSSLKT